MTPQEVEKIANAVLYEGYMLYPYTASSLKNRQRWNFGVLHPGGGSASEMQTQVLIEEHENCEFRARVRFLWYGDAEEPGEQAIDVIVWNSCRTAQLPNGGQAHVEVASESMPGCLRQVTVRVRNQTISQGPDDTHQSMLSTHTILTVQGGTFVSLMDPSPEYRDAAARCRNVGTWPVLVGEEGERDTMLSSPIILYDYPQIAAESPGDLLDGTEIDEILTLRILTLSDEEKAVIRAGGARAREVLERAEGLSPEHLMKLHGAVRGLRRVSSSVREGDRVRLRPRKSADILDIALAGKLARVESVERDYEGNLHVAVVLDDDPGRELGMLRQPGHRFFFGVEEVEPAS